MNSKILSLLALALMAGPMAASALSFQWSFAVGSGSTSGVGETVRGTISGLVEGNNPGSGLTVTVDSTPTGELTGSGWVFSGSHAGSPTAFRVTAGAVDFYSAWFARNPADALIFGDSSSTNFFPELADYGDDNPRWKNNGGQVTFTRIPEPGTFALLSLGLLGLGFTTGRRLH